MALYSGKSFSGKAALLHSRKETRKEEVDKFRCSICQVPIMPDTHILWCPVPECPRTAKRHATPAEALQLGMGQRRGRHNEER